MKQLLIFFAVLMMALTIPQGVKAYSFSAVAPTGQTLYYNISGSNVSVTCPNSDGWSTYPAPSGSLTIPASVTYNGLTYSVTSIGAWAFYGCISITSVNIPNSVTSIGNSAFMSCHTLTSVTIPNSVIYIGLMAFFNCRGLTSITIPNSVTSIGDESFGNCFSLTSVTIPSTVTSIGSQAFSRIRHIEYHGTATGAPWGAFSINGVTIGSFIFSDVAEDTLIAYIGSDDTIEIPNTVTTIGNGAFYHCLDPTMIAILNSVTSIGSSSFEGCAGLTSVTIPNSVTSIGEHAFSGCSNLDTVYMTPMIAPTIGSYCFANNQIGRVFIIQCGSYNSYYYASGWSSYRSALRNDVNILINVSPSDSLFGTTEVVPQQGSAVSCDSTAIIRATANYGYHFDHWSNGSASNPDTLFLTGDSNVTAFFLPNQYTLTLQSADESLGTVSGAGTYYYLDTVEIVATPIEHYHLVQWTWHNNEYHWYDDEGSFDNPLHFVVRYDATITAYFAIDTHTVSVTTNDIARGMVQSTGTEFEYGTPCTVTATAYTGYTFAGWSNGVTANPYTFAVLSDVELTALFIAEGEEVYAVTVVSANPSKGSVSGGGQAMSGGEVTIRAISNPGYHFLRWNDNNTDSVRTVTVTANATYTAYFEANNVGIDDADLLNAKVFSCRGQIVVEGANGNMVTLYDVAGRVLASKHDEDSPLRFDTPASGTYMIKIGNYPARKVVVIR